MNDSPYQYSFNVEEIIARYLQRSSGEIYDAVKAAGFPDQAADIGLHPVRSDMVLAGPAFTVKAVPEKYVRPDRNELWAGMVAALEATEVPVVEIRDCTGEDKIAMYGDVAATIASRCGAVGTIVDGAIRDSRVLENEEYPIFSRTYSPVAGGGWYSVREWQIPIGIKGATTAIVTIRPGDFVIADRDGTVVVPKDVILDVLERAEARATKEDAAREAYRTAVNLEEIHKKFGRL